MRYAATRFLTSGKGFGVSNSDSFDLLFAFFLFAFQTLYNLPLVRR